jgi:hypothetical protein
VLRSDVPKRTTEWRVVDHFLSIGAKAFTTSELASRQTYKLSLVASKSGCRCEHGKKQMLTALHIMAAWHSPVFALDYER